METGEDKSVEKLLEDCEKKGYKQIVLTGAPGTGKTFSAEKYAEKGGISELVQFHPSYDYTDFVEGIRPIDGKKSDGDVEFKKIDGHFKAFCRKVVEANIKDYKEIDDENIKPLLDKYKALIEEVKTEDNKKLQMQIEKGLDGSYEGAKKHYFIIDEINRADISKVFGELMYLFEKRGVAHRKPTQYQNLETYFEGNNKYDCFEDGFFIPENVVIIGTMNDIDKSVESFDFAMRRRFYWIPVEVKDVLESVFEGMFSNVKKNDRENLCKKVLEMNKKLEETAGLSKDYDIGPAYFEKYEKLRNDPDNSRNQNQALGEIFDTYIASIIREYVRGRKDIKDVEKNIIKPCRDALVSKTNKK